MISFLLKERIGNKFYCPFFQPPFLLKSSIKWLNFRHLARLTCISLCWRPPSHIHKNLRRICWDMWEMCWRWLMSDVSPVLCSSYPKFFNRPQQEVFLPAAFVHIIQYCMYQIKPLSVHKKSRIDSICHSFRKTALLVREFPPTRIFPPCVQLANKI